MLRGRTRDQSLFQDRRAKNRYMNSWENDPKLAGGLAGGPGEDRPWLSDGQASATYRERRAMEPYLGRLLRNVDAFSRRDCVMLMLEMCPLAWAVFCSCGIRWRNIINDIENGKRYFLVIYSAIIAGCAASCVDLCWSNITSSGVQTAFAKHTLSIDGKGEHITKPKGRFSETIEPWNSLYPRNLPMGSFNLLLPQKYQCWIVVILFLDEAPSIAKLAVMNEKIPNISRWSHMTVLDCTIFDFGKVQ